MRIQETLLNAFLNCELFNFVPNTILLSELMKVANAPQNISAHGLQIPGATAQERADHSKG